MQKSSLCTKLVSSFLTLLIGVMLPVGCGDHETMIVSEKYFPLHIGYRWIYDVEETTTIRNLCTDDGVASSSYELKVEIVSAATNIEGGTTYTFQRSKRASPTDSWIPLETWAAQQRATKLVVNQANVMYVKLVFPVVEGVKWNGNEFNTEIQLNGKNEDTYEMISTHQPYSINSKLSFPKTVTVIQNLDEDNFTRRDVRKEIYALGVGLIYKESFVLKYFTDSNLPNSVCFAQKRVQKGTTLKHTLKEFFSP